MRFLLWPALLLTPALLLAETPKPGDKDFDPFAEYNRAAKTAEPPRPVETRTEKIDFEVSLPTSARRGEVIKLVITGKPRKGFHTYPLTVRSPKQEPAQLSKLTYSGSRGLSPLYPIEESEPEFVKDKAFGVILEHEKPFTWTQNVLVSPDAAPGKTELKFTVRTQVCDESGCEWIKRDFTVPVTIDDRPAATVSSSVKQQLSAAPPDIEVKDPPSDLKDTDTTTDEAESSSLLGFILQGVFWGAVSLITPCVFPMIPITVSFFLKQSEKEGHRPMLTAVVYCATIVVVLTIAAVALLSFFRAVSNFWLMNFFLGALFIFFALSLFGMYEIELPSGLAKYTSSREGSGLGGTMFMALTFTIISFACVAPFLGGFGGTAASAKLGFFKILLGGLAFSLTFASPFLLLALFPALLKKLPKSGTWLNSVKVVMGFLEVAAALKFFRQGELLITAQTTLFTYDFVLGLYVAICVLTGLYLLCVFRLPHDTPLEHLGVPRMLLAMFFLGLGLYLAPAMFKANEKGATQRPRGVVFAWLDSFLLPEHVKDLPWIGDLDEGIQTAAKTPGKRIFIDFTGKTCTNCKINEREVFTQPEVRELLLQYVLVAQYTDRVPDDLLTEEQKKKGISPTDVADDNLTFQRKEFNTEQLPLYVIVEPDGKDGWRKVAVYKEGKINDVEGFVAFLRDNARAGYQVTRNTRTSSSAGVP